MSEDRSNPARPISTSGTALAVPRHDFPVWLVAVGLALLTLVLYWPVVGYGFVGSDDVLYVTANPHVQGGLTLGNVLWALTTSETSNWHPVTWLSLMLDASLFGTRADGFHLTNVALHVANSVLLFGLLRRLTLATWRSAMVAAFFACHPVHVESVAWVAERKDVLSTFFGFAALLFYERYARQTEIAGQNSGAGKYYFSRWYWLAWSCLALGLLSKPMLVTWPFVLLLLDYWPLDRWKAGGIARLILEKVPFLVLAAAASLVTFLVQFHGGAVVPVQTLPLDLRMENAVISYLRYLGKLFWPTNLAAFYPFPNHWPMADVWLGSLLLVAFSAFVVAARSRYPFAIIGWLWYLGTLVPVIGLVQVGEQAMADRYAYIPSVGVLILIVWGADELTRRWRFQKVVLAWMGAAGILACLFLARQQLAYWQDGETLFRHALAVTTDNHVACNNLGGDLLDQGRITAAIGEYQEAVRLKPKDPEFHDNLGLALGRNGQLDAAISEFQEALRMSPDYVQAHNNLGIALAGEGHIDAAIVQFHEALRLRPDYAAAKINLGKALELKGRSNEGHSSP